MPPPDNARRRPWAEAAPKTSHGTTVTADSTQLGALDSVIPRALAAVVPCPLCHAGLCMRCWTVARAVEQLTIASRRDQAVDDGWVVAA